MSPDTRHARRTYDTFHMGRSCMDLYSNNVGAAFIAMKRSTGYVDGSPTNMSAGRPRRGLNPALLTAFGKDPVADFVAPFLNRDKGWISVLVRGHEFQQGTGPERNPFCLSGTKARTVPAVSSYGKTSFTV